MKVLHLSTYDDCGGAARAATRLHRALLAAGVDSRMVVMEKSGDAPATERLPGRYRSLRNVLRQRCDAWPLRRYANRKAETFSADRTHNGVLLRCIADADPDIVHLHWTHHGFLSLDDIGKIDRPIVWTMHDLCAFTGGCHYPQECLRYREKCGDCPILRSGTENDLSRRIFERKAEVYPRLKGLRIVAPSEWLASSARQSVLLGGADVSVVSNALDVNHYHPMTRSAARSLLNLPQDRKLILFGAQNVLHDCNKGFDLLQAALASLECNDAVELVLFGAPVDVTLPELPVPVHNLGVFRDDASLCAIYNACDVMAVPSRQDNQPQTATEALACGTPVVAFRASGVQEVVAHGEDGYLAEPFDVVDFARGIEAMLNAADAARLRERAREEAVRRFAFDVVAPQYERIYRDLLSKS